MTPLLARSLWECNGVERDAFRQYRGTSVVPATPWWTRRLAARTAVHVHVHPTIGLKRASNQLRHSIRSRRYAREGPVRPWG